MWLQGVISQIVKIVTDSASDVPPALVEELGIVVVPVYLRFGNDVYRDKVDIGEDEFYRRLITDPVHPATTQPTPQDFAGVYRELSGNTDGIVSIHISSALSGTYNSAVQGKKLVENGCPVDIIDSRTISVANGLLVMHAARMAVEGKTRQEITAAIKRLIPDIDLLILFDTLRYLAKGGRIGKARALLGSVLNVKPLITIKDGELVPAGQVRTRARGKQKLLDLIRNAPGIQELFVVYNTTLAEAEELAEYIGSMIPGKRIILARAGPAIGVHAGPGVLAVGFIRNMTEQ